MVHFLIHEAADSQPLKAHSTEASQPGHKLALKDFAVGDEVIKYGCVIGNIVKPVKAVQHVHTHNLTTKRWA